MSNEAHYRKQADLCRSEALIRRADPAASAQWLKIAAEYDKLADNAAAMAETMPQQAQQQPAGERVCDPTVFS